MNDAEMIEAIQAEVADDPCEVAVAWKYRLHDHPVFAECRQTVEAAFCVSVVTGWCVRYAPGFEGQVHQDGHDLVIYYPMSHPAALRLDDEVVPTTVGTFQYVPKAVVHGCEPVLLGDGERVAVVWVIEDAEGASDPG